MNDEILRYADELKSLRDKKVLTDEKLKGINAKIKTVEEKLSDLMLDNDTPNFTRSGTMFTLTTKTRASASAAYKNELYDTLKAQGYGDLVYETVNANSLSSFVKEQIEQNNDTLPEWLDGLVNVFEQTAVTVRKGRTT